MLEACTRQGTWVALDSYLRRASGTAFVPATSQCHIFPYSAIFRHMIFPYSAIYIPPKSATWWTMVIPCHQSMPCFVNFHICTLQRENHRLAFIDQLIDFFRGGHILQYISPCFRQLFEESWEWHPHGSRPAFILRCLLSVMVWYSVVWYNSMVWYGMLWYGMVWGGVVWDGIAWYGLLSVMAIRKEKHGHIGRPGLYNASIYS